MDPFKNLMKTCAPFRKIHIHMHKYITLDSSPSPNTHTQYQGTYELYIIIPLKVLTINDLHNHKAECDTDSPLIFWPKKEQ